MSKDPQACKAELIAHFDPDQVGTFNGRLFGLPFGPEEAEVVLIPVPWEATVSYRAGTAQGPAAILAASPQLDFYDPDLPDGWQTGVALLPIPTDWAETNDLVRKKARVCIEILESGGDPNSDAVRLLAKAVNDSCRELLAWVEATATHWLSQGKLVGVLGGDHSSPLGLMRALAAREPAFGILQIDAHCDLRQAYQTFELSHASIMYRALESPAVERLVQVGIRDYCRAEAELAAASGGRVQLFTDRELRRRRLAGASWAALCAEVVATLPPRVYISFDIDGLDPTLCPQTGTPVPGGLQFEEVFYLIEEVVASGRQVIGFDLCEVSAGGAEGGDSWDAMVGARVLWRLAHLAAASQGRTPQPWRGR